MGLADRDYARDEPRGIFLGGDRPMYVNLILINVAIYLVGAFFFPNPRPTADVDRLSDHLSLTADLFTHPWNAWQLLTYGFAHSAGITHILFNMIGLWFFGSEIEGVYGRKEFLRVYLSIIILSGLVWVGVTELSFPSDDWKDKHVVGASGGVVGIAILFICHFPKRTVLFFGIVPMPAWVLAIIMVLGDIRGALNNENIAFTVHMAGAAWALIYYKSGWNLGRYLPAGFSLSRLKPGPKLRLHEPEIDQPSLDAEVDRILAKISQDGEASLTAAERKTLEKASRRYQQRRR